jgi:hypothetical protein
VTISSQIIADSISPQGIRLTTFQLRYPRFIHAEFMTHRMFSRNASSSRAIPVSRLIEDIQRDTAMPVHWGKNQSGMQAVEELDEDAKRQVQACWGSAREEAIAWAQTMHNVGAHKQIVNRILEPFSHINVVCTATDYANFYALRRHKDAQPEIKVLADAMWDAQQNNVPQLLLPGEWHLPYVLDEEIRELDGPTGPCWTMLKHLSVARCARVSYLTHEGKVPNIEEDLRLYVRLVGGNPLHASPAEHQATPDTENEQSVGFSEMVHYSWDQPKQHGNLTGWRQYRKTLHGEWIAG